MIRLNLVIAVGLVSTADIKRFSVKFISSEKRSTGTIPCDAPLFEMHAFIPSMKQTVTVDKRISKL